MSILGRFALAAAMALGMPSLGFAQDSVPEWLQQPLKKPMNEVVIGLTNIGAGVNGYVATYLDTFDAYAKELGVQIVVLDAQVDPQKQASQVQNLVAQNVDTLIVWAVNGTAIVPSIKKAHEAGVPVMITNSPIDQEGYQYIKTYTGPNSYTQAMQAAELMAEALDGKGNVVMINGLPGYTVSEERISGFLEVMKKYPDIKILDSQPADWSREKAQTLMENYITRFGNDIDGVYSAESGMGSGALNAVLAAVADGKLEPNSIKFTDCTLFASGYDAILDGGYYFGSVFQSPEEDARLALKAAVMIAQGMEVPPVMNFETPSVTAANIKDFARPSF